MTLGLFCGGRTRSQYYRPTTARTRCRQPARARDASPPGQRENVPRTHTHVLHTPERRTSLNASTRRGSFRRSVAALAVARRSLPAVHDPSRKVSPRVRYRRSLCNLLFFALARLRRPRGTPSNIPAHVPSSSLSPGPVPRVGRQRARHRLKILRT